MRGSSQYFYSTKKKLHNNEKDFFKFHKYVFISINSFNVTLMVNVKLLMKKLQDHVN